MPDDKPRSCTSDAKHFKKESKYHDPEVMKALEDQKKQLYVSIEEGKTPVAWEFAFLIQQYGKAKKPNLVTELLEKLQKTGIPLDRRSYNVICDAFVEQGRVTEAEKIASEMTNSGLHWDLVTYHTLLKGYARLKSLEKMEHTFAQLQAAGFRPNTITWNTLLHGFVEAKQVERALTIFDQMDDPDVISYTTIIRGLGTAEKIGKAFELLDDMAAKKVRPTVITYNVLLEACFAAKDMVAFRKAFQQMQFRKVQPDAFTYSILLKGHVAAGKQGLDVLQRKEGQPDENGYQFVLDAMSNCGDADLVQESYRQLRKRIGKPNVVTYSTFIQLLGRYNKLDEAFSILQEMEESHITPNVFTWSNLIDACIRSGDVNRAMDTFEKMRLSGCKANAVTYNILAKGLMSAKRYEDIIRLKGYMDENGITPNQMSYGYILNACTVTGDMELAEKIAEECMVNVGGNDVVFNSLIKGYTLQKKLESALETMDRMRGSGFTPDVFTYSTLISCCFEVSEPLKALELYNQMTAEGVRPNLITFNTLLLGLSRAKLPSKAVDIWNKMQALRIQPDLLTSGALASVYLALSDAPAATEFLFRAESLGFRPSRTLVHDLMRFWSSRKDVRQTQRLFDLTTKWPQLQPNAWTYGLLITANIRAKDPDRCVELFEAAHKAGFDLPVGMYNQTIGLFGKAGRSLDAEQLFKRMEQMGVPTSAQTLAMMVQSFFQTGDLRAARDWIAIMKERGVTIDEAVFCSMICGFHRSRQPEEAIQSYNDMLQSQLQPNQYALNAVFESFLQLGDSRSARDIADTYQNKGFKPNVQMQSLLRSHVYSTKPPS